MTPPESSIPFGFCRCGCGNKTKIADQSSTELGWKRGQPIPFLLGHRVYQLPRLIRDVIEQPEDPLIRHIPLTHGKFSIVDASDFDWLSQWNWGAFLQPKNGRWYAKRNWTGVGAGRNHRTVWMHRAILGLETGDKRVVDHVDPLMTLDNRRSNIRIATHSQNHANTRLNKRNTSGIKGVFFDKRRGNWVARISAAYPTAELAKSAYERMAIAVYGEFANFG